MRATFDTASAVEKAVTLTEIRSVRDSLDRLATQLDQEPDLSEEELVVYMRQLCGELSLNAGKLGVLAAAIAGGPE